MWSTPIQLYSVGRAQARAALVAQTKLPTSPPKRTLCEKLFGAIPKIQASLGRNNSTAICGRFFHNHHWTASTKTANTIMKQPLQCYLHPWLKLYSVGRARARAAPVAQTRFPTSTPGRAYFAGKKIRFRAIPFSPRLRSTITANLWIFNRSPAHEIQQLRAGACIDFATVFDQHLRYGQQMLNYKPSALVQGSTLNPTIAM